MKSGMNLKVFLDYMESVPIVFTCELEDGMVANLTLRNKSQIRLKLIIADSGYPKQINEIIKNADYDCYNVILAPYITEQTAELCKNAKIGYFDMSGNCYISYDCMHIEVTGKENKNKPKRALKSIYEKSSTVSSMVLRTMLRDVNKTWKLKDLAIEAGCSIGQVSKVKDFLLNQSLLEQSKDGIRLTNPAALMREWAKVYSGTEEEKVFCYSLDSIATIESKIAKMKEEIGVDCLLTGFSGGVRYQPVVRYQKVHAIIEYENVEKAIAYLGLKKVDSGANVVFILKYHDCVEIDMQRVNHNDIASRVQVYLDCMKMKGRGEEMAEAVLEREICK